jgi:hypothetical protein
MTILGKNVNTIKNTEGVLQASGKPGINRKLIAWLCLATKIPEKILIYRLKINAFKMWQALNI